MLGLNSSTEINGRLCWIATDGFPELKKSEAHIWRASLQMPGFQLRAFRQMLADDEISRAERFSFPADRDRFIIARGLLRTILAGYLNMKPEKIRFRFGSFGKPELAGDAIELSFSTSHSKGLALYAVTHGRKIGVDLEYISSGLKVDEIARQFFPEEERLFKSPAHVRREIFFTLWTRMEAYLKAQGVGLAGPLRKKDGDALWSFTDIQAAHGYAASIAIEGHGVGLHFLHWAGSPQ